MGQRQSEKVGQEKITKSNWDDLNLIQNSRSFILKYSSQNIKWAKIDQFMMYHEKYPVCA